MDTELKKEELQSADELVQKEKELEEREAALEQKESVLKKAEERITNAKHNLYSRIDISLGTMNKVVGVLAVALLAAIIVGILGR